MTGASVPPRIGPERFECALIGREGAVGAASVLGLRRAVTRDVCHVEARASRLEARRLIEACSASPRIQEVIDQYMARKLCTAIRNGACNACHSVEQRLSRWLLTCSDVLESDEIALSQDVFAKMLGVQRTSVNPTLRALQAGGAVALARSRVAIRDRSGAETPCLRVLPGDAARSAAVGALPGGGAGGGRDARASRKDS